jgi:hypothetical protein
MERNDKENIPPIYDILLLTVPRNERKLYFPQLRHIFPLEHSTSNAQYNLVSMEMNWRYQPQFYFDDISLLGINVSTIKNSLEEAN